MDDRRDLTLHINGQRHDIRLAARKTLADAIREDCGLTGTHTGCEHGVCGACTILVDGDPVRSCLMFAVQAEGRDIRTVEGLAERDNLHPLQQAFIDHHALQCGFCTPGFLMLIIGALAREPDPSEAALVDLIASNMCRCTGYKNIIEAVRWFEGRRSEKGES
ncbi:MAG: Caffeine dehydrogenase subunit gamma [Alphaproteobacteria bacterium MarineAlpha10_Bin3]|jgi:carbon-monoxide dehydrogenase small subunit|nr:MAG: Caffeine dehydrogenase subunit gamma [Alphaproteobacteria bacterium MarineAlpha10_Bin3]PPR70732.1 MAG: Caffeine dehydrogenase subunit gamma [Alphaproteobacteria bacterium MarineAlpha4_Bin1]